MDTSPLDPAPVKRLRALYAELPTIECQQLCSNSCRTRIGMSTAERVRIERASGQEVPGWMSRAVGRVCALLSEKGTCTVYGVRPMICRLWGLTDSMRCPHGCTPSTGTWLNARETFGLIADAYEVGGGLSDAHLAELRRMLANPVVPDELYDRMIAGDHAAGSEILKLNRRRTGGGPY